LEFLVPKYRRDPNEKVASLYYGVAPGGTTITRLEKKSRTQDKMEVTRTYGAGIPRGQGGNIATLIIGGMETTLDEMEDILAIKKQKEKENAFIPRRSNKEVADMCHILLEQRNDKIRHLRKNPSEVPNPRPKIRLHLPVGYRMAETPEPGLRMLARI
jgi:hypothetical protein